MENTEFKRKFFRLLKNFRDVGSPHQHTPEQCDMFQHLKMAEGHLLFRITTDGAVSPESLKDELGVSKSAVSQMLSNLEGEGFIRREIDPDDRRRIIVLPTDKTKALSGHLTDHMDGLVETIISRFGMEKAETLLDLIEELSEIIKSIKEENCDKC